MGSNLEPSGRVRIRNPDTPGTAELASHGSCGNLDFLGGFELRETILAVSRFDRLVK